MVPVRAADDDLQEPLVLPPTTDRDGNIYILHEQVTRDAVIYVGDPYGSWVESPPGGPAADTAQTDPHVHALGTSQDMAWFWAGDGGQVSGTTGECKQVIDKDPLTLTDLRVIAATPYIHGRSAAVVNRGCWHDALRRNPDPGGRGPRSSPLRQLLQLSASDATCVDVLGVGSDPDTEEIVVVYSHDERSIGIPQADGRTIGRRLSIWADEVFV